MTDSRLLVARLRTRFDARAAAMAGLVLAAAAAWPVSTSGQRSSVVAAVEPLPSFSEPAISPDRTEIAVVSGGDIWTVPAAGGDARLLVSHDAAESRPLYSPEGDRIAFVSDRTGGGDIYVLTLKTGVLEQVTVDDGLRAAGRVVEGRQVALLLVDGSRHRRDERHLPRACRRRDADAGERGPLHGRVLRGAVARRSAPGVHRARQQLRAVVAERTFAPGRVRAVASRHTIDIDRGARSRASLRAPDRARRQAHVADVERRRPEPLLHVRSERRAEHLDDAEQRWRRQTGHPLHRRTRAVADDLVRRPHDCLRARLRGVEARYGQRPGQRGSRSRSAGCRRARRPST